MIHALTTSIDQPDRNDNRNYDYSAFPIEERPEYTRIIPYIKPQTSILDLGCGNGSLLQKLIREKNVAGVGMEISETGVQICRQKGLQVMQGFIDEPLPFPDNTFDYAICNVTIQMVRYPEILLSEMKRVARFQIVSFPNFAFYKNRIEMLLKGRMPKKNVVWLQLVQHRTYSSVINNRFQGAGTNHRWIENCIFGCG